MEFESTQIKGKGRGRPMGFPTINLKIPDNFKLKDGVYAARVIIEKNLLIGALHYGPTPTFNQQEKSLEVYLIGLSNSEFQIKGLENLDGKKITIEIVKYLRGITKFKLVEKLIKQIQEDVESIKKIF